MLTPKDLMNKIKCNDKNCYKNMDISRRRLHLPFQYFRVSFKMSLQKYAFGNFKIELKDMLHVSAFEIYESYCLFEMHLHFFTYFKLFPK